MNMFCTFLLDVLHSVDIWIIISMDNNLWGYRNYFALFLIFI